ncbi:ABC transporter permease subunit [Nonomuraea sp. K274]|uniref:ABC transporter permease subunit n=1 Tax=Nonomuraea cypriaca TaxID=1187855 RepID=A0A931A6U5_9ACTN|nr:ABC transporter permease subunit [Nonomuraea cypriaca]MBF8184469.1 ABC transporter permease subunit [Nonomuraea cypriaca]
MLTSIGFSLYYGLNIAISSEQGRNDFPTDLGAGPTTGLVLTQWAIVALALVMVCSEYSTGNIRSTLQWVPRRSVVLVAKAVVAALVGLVTGWVAGLVGALAGWPAFGGYGVFDGPKLVWDVFATGVVLAGIAVIAVGIAAAVRSAAGTLGVSILVLLLLPMLMDASGVAIVESAVDYLPFAAPSTSSRPRRPTPAGSRPGQITPTGQAPSPGPGECPLPRRAHP